MDLTNLPAGTIVVIVGNEAGQAQVTVPAGSTLADVQAAAQEAGIETTGRQARLNGQAVEDPASTPVEDGASAAFVGRPKGN